MKRSLYSIFALTLGWFSVTPAMALEVQRYPALVKLVEIMEKEDGYPREELISVLSQADFKSKIIELMDRPYESKAWHEYRALFVKESRIRQGVRFWRQNESILKAAEKRFGVPSEIIVALIGVETNYGSNLGNRSVLDSLVTLTAGYPRRSEFFGKELRSFLNSARRDNIDEKSVVGSYAGAIGIPQFMPTSYEAYSIDFNDNGRRDLVNEVDDAIGSVANYLSVHGWTGGEAIFAPVTSDLSESALSMVSKRAKPQHLLADLLGAGVEFDTRDGSRKGALFSLTEKSGERYVVGFHNFYAITRYNTSKNYAMAVIELSREIADRLES